MLIFAIHLYRWFSPLLVALAGPLPRCRFNPSCSQYAIDAIKNQGALKGSFLAVWRLCRCNPWGGFGNDPAPEKGAPILTRRCHCSHQDVPDQGTEGIHSGGAVSQGHC